MKPGFILTGQWGLFVLSIALLKVCEARLCLKLGPAESACTFTAVLKVCEASEAWGHCGILVLLSIAVLKVCEASEAWGHCGILVLLSIAVLKVCEAKIHLTLGPLEYTCNCC